MQECSGRCNNYTLHEADPVPLAMGGRPLLTSAVIFRSPRIVAFDQIDMPPPGPGEVQVRTEYSSVSAGTEGWVLKGEFTWGANRFPGVPGYQRVGRIVAVGEGVTGYAVGDRVVATVGRWTGDVGPEWGSHVLVGNTSASEVYTTPDGVDPIELSGVVVAQVGYNASSRIALEPGDWVAVYGDGLIGQYAAQAACARGARVVLVGHRAERLAIGRAVSADLALDSGALNVAEAFREATGSEHLAAVIDTVQTIAAQAEYMPLLRHGAGQIVYSGFTPTDTWANMARLQQQELTAHFVSGWRRERMEATIALIAECKLQTRPLITHLVDASCSPEIYNAILNKDGALLGATLDWTNL